MSVDHTISRFLASLGAGGTNESVDDVLKPCIKVETVLRNLWAKDRGNDALQNHYVGLVDVLGPDVPSDIRVTRRRHVKDEADLSAKHIFPLSDTTRRQDGEPSMVLNLEEFKNNWAIFSENSLSQLSDWNNVVVAGGSVLACLLPMDKEHKKTKRTLRKYFHGQAYSTSDVDVFLWGLNAEQAEKKINQIYEAVRDSVPWDVTCTRTKHTVSIHSQYPYRSVQIVLRLYQSPAEILAGFDVDAPCVAYDGQHVWANPRSIVALMRQCNTVDMSRRSPSYEVRLTKYSTRGFEVYVPSLNREAIDPTIFERSIARIEGLARLLVLEKLITADARDNFLEARRSIRGRPNALSRYRKGKKMHKGDLKANIDSFGGLGMNDYDVISLHIPYGPGWDARRIDKLVYATDLGMNSTFNPKNKGRRLHRHPAFFGTMEECLEDCCECCPQPIDDDEKALQTKEDEQYIRGRISFVEADPGRQTMSGSFKPIDVGEWSDQTYITPSTKLFKAIAQHDRRSVQSILKSPEFDPARRDHVGRTPLHVAILCGSQEIACDIVDVGVRVTARLADGKAALHLAAQMDQVLVVQKLLQKSDQNKKIADKNAVEEEKGESQTLPPDSSTDDWSSHDSDAMVVVDGDEADSEEDHDGDVDMGDEEAEADQVGDEEADKEAGDEEQDEDSDDEQEKKKSEETANPAEQGELPEDKEEEPDIIDINMVDWDLAFPPLFYAVVYASLPVINALLEAGADSKLVSKAEGYESTAFHSLTLLILRQDRSTVASIAERLITAGASASEADDELRTIFHHAVAHNQHDLVKAFLKLDKNARTLINFPLIERGDVQSPIVSAVVLRQHSMVALLLALGATLDLSDDDASKALEQRKQKGSYYCSSAVREQIMRPLEISIAKADVIFKVLVSLGADISALLRKSQQYDISEDSDNSPNNYQTLLDWVRGARKQAQKKVAEDERPDVEEVPETEDVGSSGWRAFVKSILKDTSVVSPQEKARREQEKSDYRRRNREVRDYLVEAEALLLSRGAKTYAQLRGKKSKQVEDEASEETEDDDEERTSKKQRGYMRHFYPITEYDWSSETVLEHTKPLYEQLFRAAWSGDNDKIEELCLPKEDAPVSQSPLQVGVQVKNSEDDRKGITTFTLAILGRRWDTARLILAIAAAQYDEKEKVFSLRGLGLDDRDDGADADDYDSDVTEQEEAPRKVINFKDISQRPSPVKCDCSPSRLLLYTMSYQLPNEEFDKDETLIHRAVDLDDLEAFTQIASLYPYAGVSRLDEHGNLIKAILDRDLPDHLDEYIRKTGSGIFLETHKDGEHGDDDVPQAVNDANRIYLGLKVHGKKRKDLAKKNDPNAVADADDASERQPLLWRAIRQNAVKIVDYIHGDRPLNAYRFYAKTKTEEKAFRLRKIVKSGTLDEVLPDMLGWKITELGESPLTAGVMAGDVDVVKKLFALQPKLIKSALHVKTKFSGWNLFNVAAASVATTRTMLDFLIHKSVSPAENSSVTGFNIFHELMRSGTTQNILLAHLLKKLPRDTVEELLAQQSKEQNTPLHLAVKQGNIYGVKALLSFTPSSVLATRDILGNTPLHLAVAHDRTYPMITRVLLEHASSASNTDLLSQMLFSENGIGDTPLESLRLSYLLRITREEYDEVFGKLRWPPELDFNEQKLDVDKLPRDELKSWKEIRDDKVPAVRKVLADLASEGTVRPDDKLVQAWNEWAVTMERSSTTRIEALERANKVDEEEQRKIREEGEEFKTGYDTGPGGVYEADEADVEKTLRCIVEFIRRASGESVDTDASTETSITQRSERPLPRYLVHLGDVQVAVKVLLERSEKTAKDKRGWYASDNHGGLDHEHEDGDGDGKKQVVKPWTEYAGLTVDEDM